MQKMQQNPDKNIFNRLVRCQEFKIISFRLEIRNQHVEMHQIPSMEEKSATSSAKPVSLHGSSEGHEMLKRNDKCHSIADDVPIPKMYFFFIKISRWPFSKIALLCLTRYLFL